MPTSPLQLFINWMAVKRAVELNERWHSRLPRFTFPPEKCTAFGAEFGGVFYAAAIWSPPVARRLNWTGRYELRRLAIAPDAPRYTASRMLRVMRLKIAADMPDVRVLISYQDTEVHTGCIYRAAGWKPVSENKVPADGWRTRAHRSSAQTDAAKARWEYIVRDEP